MSILLTGTTESLQVVLDAAPATNQLPCTASYADQNGSGGDNTVNTNGTTPVTLVAAPAASVSRVINDVVIPNADTATRIVTVNKVISGTPFRLVRITLLAGYSLGYGGGRWYVIDPSGNFLETVQAQQSGSWSVSVAGTPNVNLADVGGGVITLGQKTSSNSLPVVIASDQSNLSIIGSSKRLVSNVVTGTTPVSIITAAATILTGISVTIFGAVLGSIVNLQVKDGGGNVIFAVNLPTIATGPSTITALLYEFTLLNIPLNNGGVNGTAALLSNLTSGSFLVAISTN